VLTGSPNASSYEDVISNNFNPISDPIYDNIVARHPNVQLVNTMGTILQDKSLLDDPIHPNAQGWEVYNQSVLDAARNFLPTQTTDQASTILNIPEEQQNYL